MNRFLLAALCLGLPSIAHAAPSAPGLMRAMQQAESTIQYQGVQTLTQRGAPTITVRVWRSGARQRWEFARPEVMSGDLLIDNGRIVKRYLKAENTVFETRSIARRNREFDGTRASFLSEATIAGRAAYVVGIAARGGKKLNRKVWIDKATKSRLRIERLDASGASVETIALQNVKFGPVAAAQFEWTPPQGAQITRTQGMLFTRLNAAQRAADWLQVPRVLPAGFSFESAVIDPGGEAWLRYTNGTSRFSIFQQKAAGEDAAPKQVDGGWFLKRGGSRFLVVGAPPDHAQRVAESIR